MRALPLPPNVWISVISSKPRSVARRPSAADGREQFFRLTDDPTECHNLAAVSEEAERLSHWRGLLVEELRDRAEGFTDGADLIPGRPYPAVRQNASATSYKSRH